MCVGQCYDGAAVMSGSCSGVQARILEEAPTAIYMHCCAHGLNLVLVDSVKQRIVAEDFFALMESLYVFISASKAHAIFMKKQEELRPGQQPHQLKRLSETRWACRHDAIHAIKVTFTSLIATLEEVGEGDDRSCAVEARGLLYQVKTFPFIICLSTFNLLSITNALSKTLQDRKLDLAAASELVDATVKTLHQYRSEAKWSGIWQESVLLANNCDVDIQPAPKRSSRPPKRLEEYVGTTAHGSRDNLSHESDYRSSLYYPVLDCITGEMESRFSDLGKSLMKALQSCSPKSKSFLDYSVLQPIIDHYKLNNDDIKVELIHAKELLKNKPLDSISDVIDQLIPLRVAFPNLLRQLQIALTLSVSSAACERTFSSLKRVKTYLRSTMTDERLTNLALLTIEKDLTMILSLEDVIDKFSSSDRRVILT